MVETKNGSISRRQLQAVRERRLRKGKRKEVLSGGIRKLRRQS